MNLSLPNAHIVQLFSAQNAYVFFLHIFEEYSHCLGHSLARLVWNTLAVLLGDGLAVLPGHRSEVRIRALLRGVVD